LRDVEAGEGRVRGGVDELTADLTELLCARLCHDLAGPLGAVASGVELLGEDPDPDIVGLVASSAATAVARLRFLRVVLGPAGPLRPGEEIRRLARAYLDAAAPLRFDLDWHSAGAEIEGQRIRLVLALVMVARDALPRGGTIRVTLAAAAPGRHGLSVGFQGSGAEVSAEARAALSGQSAPNGPRTAPAGWVARLAARSGATVVVEIGEDGGVLAT